MADLREQADMTQLSCAVEGCEDGATRRGWCNKHYARWRKHGDPNKTTIRQRSMCGCDGCDRFAETHGLCQSHWRQHSAGKPLTPIRPWRSRDARDDQGRKLCRECNGWLPESAFGKNGTYRDGLASICKRCNADRHRLARYGITPAQYDALLETQGGGCAICGNEDKTGRMLSVDHDHACCSGMKTCGECVRGLLCGDCNHGIGKFRDDIELLESAIAYLKR